MKAQDRIWKRGRGGTVNFRRNEESSKIVSLVQRILSSEHLSMLKELLAVYWWVLVGRLLESVGFVITRVGQQLEEVGGRCRGRRVVVVIKTESVIETAERVVVKAESVIESAERVVVKAESAIESAERVVVKAESAIEAAERVVVIAAGESIVVRSVAKEVEEEESVICVGKPARSSQRSRGRGRGVTRGGRTPLVTTGW